MFRRVGGCLAACLALSLIGVGCGGAEPQPSKPSPTPSSASPKSPSPRIDPSAQPARVKAAVIPLAKARQLGFGAPSDDGPGEWQPTASCVAVGNARDVTHSYRREWSMGARWVNHVAFAYEYWDPTTGLETVQSLVPACAEYEEDGTTFRYAGDVTLPATPGVQSYAFCERAKGDGMTWYTCSAYLVRGNLLTQLFAAELATSRSGPSQRLLQQAAAIAATAITAA